ncbi:hypothetical protein D3C75_1309100 [compost metagenome]
MGSVVTLAWYVIVTEELSAKDPRGIPAVISKVGLDMPATTTLPATNVSPGGSVSDNTTLAALAVPVLLTVTV